MSSPRSRRNLLAAATVVAVGAALASVPSAFGSDAGSSQSRDHTMYSISVRAADGDGGALADRLASAGYDVVTRNDAVVGVLGSVAVQARLAGRSDLQVVGRVNAAPTGPIAKAPASQDSILPSRLDGKKYPTYYGGYRTTVGFDEFESDLQKAYPDLVKKIQYGTSFTGKHPLNVVCVTLGADKGCKLNPNTDKPRLLLETQIHAREVATSDMSWQFLTALVDGYGSDPQVTALLKGSEIWVVPQVNPDGIALTEKGITKDGLGADSQAWQRKNNDREQAPDGGCPPPWAGSQPGIDLNRNWAFAWGGASTSKDPCSELFIGKKKMSETETKALADLTTHLFKDQRGSGDDPAPQSTVGEMLTFHTDAGVNLIPWDYNAGVKAPNDLGLRALGFRQSFFTGLETGQAGQVLYSVGGGTDDWVYNKLGVPAATWELADTAGCSGFFPPYSCMATFGPRYIPGLIYTAGAARMPYALSLGPTVLDAKTKESGSTVTVTATADDGALGASGFGRPTPVDVKAGRIFVGKAPWEGGKSTAMTLKGKGTSVTISAKVNEGADTVLAYVQAKNANGDWGPTQAVWIPAKG